MNIGTLEAKNLMVGSTQVDKICLGTEEVWKLGKNNPCNCQGPYVKWYDDGGDYHEDDYSGEGGVIPSFTYQDNSSIVSVEICGGISQIGTDDYSYVFAGCGNLSSVCISEGVEYIGGRAFENVPSLHSVSIPSSVTGIGENAFYDFDRNNGDEIYFLGGTPPSFSSGGDLGHAVVYVPSAASQQYYDAFDQAGILNNITIHTF